LKEEEEEEEEKVKSFLMTLKMIWLKVDLGRL
jgi:hypothetical protein